MAQIPGMVFACKLHHELHAPPRHAGLGGIHHAGSTETRIARTLHSSPQIAALCTTQSVTAALLDHGLPFVYGVVTNISECGACVQTGDVYTRRDIHMMLSFSDGAMLEASGRVVWSELFEADGRQALCGIEFTGLSKRKRETLRTILNSTAFAAPDR